MRKARGEWRHGNSEAGTPILMEEKCIINDGTRASFAKFSRRFRKIFEVFVAPETCWDLFGPARMRSDTFGHVRKRSEAFGRFRDCCFFQHFSRLCQIPAKPMTKCVPPRRPKSPKCALSSRLVVVVVCCCLLLFVVVVVVV